MVQTHELKTVQPYFDRVWFGTKKCEIRRNDRNFAVDDQLMLKEYDAVTNAYSDKSIMCVVTDIVNDPAFCKDGFVVMSINAWERRIHGKRVLVLDPNRDSVRERLTTDPKTV